RAGRTSANLMRGTRPRCEKAHADREWEPADEMPLRGERTSQNLIDDSRLVVLEVAARTVRATGGAPPPSHCRGERKEDRVEVRDARCPNASAFEQHRE